MKYRNWWIASYKYVDITGNVAIAIASQGLDKAFYIQNIQLYSQL